MTVCRLEVKVLRELGRVVRHIPHDSLRQIAIDSVTSVGNPSTIGILAGLPMMSSLRKNARQTALVGL